MRKKKIVEMGGRRMV